MKRKTKITAYIILAIILFLLVMSAPYSKHLVSGKGSAEVKMTIALILGATLLLSNLIAFYALPKYFKSRKLLPLLLFVLVAFTALFLLNSSLRPPPPEDFEKMLKLPPSAFGPNQIPPFPIPIISVLFLLPSALSICMLWIETVRLKEKAETEQLKSELNFLKNQLSPHFLFNSLNTIYALSQKDPELSGKATLQLSRLLRFLVYETQKEKTIAISNEVEFLNNYISLSKLRLNENTDVQFEHSIEDNEFQIPPLLLLVFVENCFKHGVTSTKDSTIKIKLKQIANELHFETTNGFIKIESANKGVGGVGLENVKRRLELNYPNENYDLKCSSVDDIFNVKLLLENL